MSTILLIFYTILFFWILKKWRFFKDSGITTTALWGLFALKLTAGLLLTWVYTSYYPNRFEADVFKYFDDSEVMYNALLSKPIDYFKMIFSIGNDNDYFFNEYYVKMNNWDRLYDSNAYNDSHTIIRANAIIRVFSMGNFHIHTLVFSIMSMIGLTSIFRVFKEFFPNKKGALIILIFLIPSVLFWSSGALKESILLFGMGILLLSLKRIMNSKVSAIPILLFLLSFTLLFFIKFYVLIALIPGIIGYVIVKKFNLSKPLIAYASIVLVCGILALNSKSIPPHFDFVETMVRKQKDFIGLVNFQESGSKFELTPLEPTLWGIAKVVPEGITNCFVRPLPWKKGNLIYIPSILENVFILFLIFIGIVSRFKSKNQLTKEHKNLLWFCITFTLILFTIIGITTPVAGALVRYKVPALPFLGIIILSYVNIELITKKIPFLKFLK